LPRRIFIVIALVVGSVLAAPLVSAEDDPRETLREAREERERTLAERAELAKELDLLEASDAELLEALQVLNDQVASQELVVVRAEDAILDAIAAEAAVRDEIEITRQRANGIRQLARDRAVEAYVAPRGDTGAGGDIMVFARREALLRYVDLDGRDLLDQMRAAEDDLDLLTEEAGVRRDQAVALDAELELALTQLRNDVEAQERVRRELSDIIGEVEAQIDAMAAADAEIAQIIRDAQREIARDEALARAATSTTTTRAPTATTTAPTDGDLPAPDDTAPDNTPPDDTTTPPAATTTTAAAAPTDLTLIWPTTGSVTSSFGSRVHPITGKVRNHTGIDIANAKGTSIWAAQSGTVIFSGRMGGYGEAVIVDHGSGASTLYAHMLSRSVSKGQAVNQGAEVGKMGSTGFSTGFHVHFELRIDGTAANPATYLQ